MTKQAFLAVLDEGLATLPQADRDRSLDYYREMIEDRIEEGLSEEEAVAAMGPLSDILAQILSETPQRKSSEPQRPARTLRAWEIVLLAVGSPIWLSLLLAGATILFSLFVALWSLVVAVYAVNVSLAAGALSGLAGAAILALTGQGIGALLLLGGGLFCAGCAIFAFFGCTAATRGSIYLGKQLWGGIRSLCTERRSRS